MILFFLNESICKRTKEENIIGLKDWTVLLLLNWKNCSEAGRNAKTRIKEIRRNSKFARIEFTTNVFYTGLKEKTVFFLRMSKKRLKT